MFVRANNLNGIHSLQNNSSWYISLNLFQIDYSNLIGKGGFGKVYLGKNKITGKEVSVKIEPKNSKIFLYFKWNKNITKLRGGFGIPKVYWSGYDNNNYILIMEKLGLSLQKDFYKYNQNFSLSMIKNIGIRILNILEDIHNRGIIHGDIKSGCFLIDNYDDFNIFILDFGFSREINQITGLPLETKSPFIGDITNASKNWLLELPASKRDDITSLGYMLIYFMKGSLPWGICKNHSTITQIKLSTSVESLCYGLPIEIKEFIDYAYNLKSNENPDYYYLRNALNRCGENIANLSNNKSDDLDLVETGENFSINCFKSDNESNKFKQINNQEIKELSITHSGNVENKDLEIIERGYLRNRDFYKINAILRTKGPMGLDEEQFKVYDALTRAINQNRTEENYLVYRYVGNDYLMNVFKFIPFIIYIIYQW